LDQIKEFNAVFASYNCEFGNCHYMDDGSSGGAYWFTASPSQYAPAGTLSWSGRTFTYLQSRDDYELKIEDTLSSTCWTLEKLKANYRSGTTEWAFEATGIRVNSAPCPGWDTDNIGYYLSGEELAPKITASGRRYNAFEQKWINYTNSDISKSYFRMEFWKE